MMSMKYVLVIGDGMADNPVPELDNKTPLEFAGIPNIDVLAARGIVGSVKNCPEVWPPGTIPLSSYFRRDPGSATRAQSLEACRNGIKLKQGACPTAATWWRWRTECPLRKRKYSPIPAAV